MGRDKDDDNELLEYFSQKARENIARNIRSYLEGISLVRPDPGKELEFQEAIDFWKKGADNIEKGKKLSKYFRLEWCMEHEDYCRDLGGM